jgi:hypothetical protein
MANSTTRATTRRLAAKSRGNSALSKLRQTLRHINPTQLRLIQRLIAQLDPMDVSIYGGL